MSSIYKYFLLFCFAVFFLSGCRSGKQDTVNVTAAGGDATKAAGKDSKTKPDSALTVDVSQMTPEKKAAYMAQAEQIKTLNIGLKTAQRLFDQVWVCLWYAKKNADNSLGECPAVSQLQTVENVFHYSQNVLANIFASNGLPFINIQNKDDCDKKNYRDVLDASSANEFVLRRRKCMSVTAKASGDVDRDKKTVSTAVVSVDLFKWSIKSKDVFELSFNVENMPEAAGLNLSFNRKNTVCTLEFKDAKTLKSLDCKNVGQNKNGNEFLLLENFVYNQQQDIAVQLNGQISTWDGQDYKTDVIRSMTVPVQGEALLEIDRVNPESTSTPATESKASDATAPQATEPLVDHSDKPSVKPTVRDGSQSVDDGLDQQNLPKTKKPEDSMGPQQDQPDQSDATETDVPVQAMT